MLWPEAAILVGPVVAPYDAMAVPTKATDVRLNAAPGDQATVLNAQLAVDVDALAWARLQKREQGLGEGWIVLWVVATSRLLTGAAEEVGVVVVGDGVAAAAAESLDRLWLALLHGASVGSRQPKG